MINVTLVNSQSDSPVLNTQVPDGTTYRKFLEFNEVSLANMVVTVRLDSERIEDGSKVTVTPEQIKGA